MYSVTAGAINHPDSLTPYVGLFNYRSLKSLAEAGTAVSVVSPRPFAPPIGPYSAYGSIPRTEDWGPYTVHHPRFWYLLPKRLLYGVSGRSYAKRIPAYVESALERPDVVHACHIYPDGYGFLPYAERHDIPLFVVSHGNLLNSFGNHPPGVSSKIRETLEAAAGVLCVSEALASTARSIADPSTVKTVPIGANPDNFPVEQRQQLRRELDIDPDATLVLFVGEFTARKGIGDLVDLLPDLDLADTEFVFVGHGGDMEEDLRDAVAESRYSLRHVYSGITTQALRRLFTVADLLVLPSYEEGRPTVIYEAMASETAVLATDVGGVAEQVVDGTTGTLFQPGDVDDLEAMLTSLVDDGGELERMGTAGLRRLRDRGWTWDDHARRVQEVHRNVID